jgi:hypothetical protein
LDWLGVNLKIYSNYFHEELKILVKKSDSITALKEVAGLGDYMKFHALHKAHGLSTVWSFEIRFLVSTKTLRLIK